MENVHPRLHVFQRQLNNRYKIEYYNARIQNRLMKFDIEWKFYLPMFQ